MRARGKHAYGVRSADMYPGTAHCQLCMHTSYRNAHQLLRNALNSDAEPAEFISRSASPIFELDGQSEFQYCTSRSISKSPYKSPYKPPGIFGTHPPHCYQTRLSPPTHPSNSHYSLTPTHPLRKPTGILIVPVEQKNTTLRRPARDERVASRESS